MELKRSSVPREAVKKVEEKSLQAFRQVMGRNPNSREAEKITRSVHHEANKLNRDRR
jgi:hypothetical protein